MSSTSTIYRAGRFEVRPAQRMLLAGGKAVAVGARAFDVLVALLEHRDRVVSAQELFDLAWPGLVVEENNLRQQVAALRKLLGPEAIVTVAGRGYRFGLELDAADAATRSLPAARIAAASNNLPVNLPTLIGREAELASVMELGRSATVLTLVGAGGVGKTRLALEVADRVKDTFKDGTWLVELAPVADPSLLTRVVASALDIHEERDRPLLDTLLDFLRNAQLLIVLDNCEHLIEACARWVERVVQASAGLRVLATSREPLGIACEQVWRVLSLSTPQPGGNLSHEQLMTYAAPQLFVQRAMAAEPGFRVAEGNAGAVARICHQLDGIPLALELAAARVKSMRVEQVADRLRDRFALLTRGSRTALERHQTLRSLIDWSHELLAEHEKVLLRRLSVFAGGWTLEAAESACAGDGLAEDGILELLAALVEKSLVMLDGQAAQPRYRMLETIRQYGLEKLQAAGEEGAVRTRHLHQLVGFAEAIRARLTGSDQLHWHAKAEAELDNIRVALNWAHQANQPESGLRVLNALHRHWYKTMQWGEIADWQRRLAECFEQQGALPNEHYARSFYMAGMLATNFHPQTGRSLCERCVEVSRRLGFDEGMAWAMMWIAHVDLRKRDPATAELFAEGVRIGRRIQDPWVRSYFLGNALVCYANYEAAMGRDASAQAMLRECEDEIVKAGNDAIYIGHSRALLATMAIRRGDLEQAEQLVAESLALHRAVDSRFDVGAGLAQQGLIALRRGDPLRALQLFKESLPLHRHYPMSQWVTKGLAQLLIAYSACGQWPVAARLAGALATPDVPVGSPPLELSASVAQAYEEAVARAHSALGPADFDREVEAGMPLTREQAIALALGEAGSATGGS